MTEREIREGLYRRNFDEKYTNEVLSELVALAPELEPSLNAWLTGEVMKDIRVDDWTIEKLMDTFKMNFVAAILSLDFLIKEPELAKKVIEQGYDRVEIS